MRPKRGQEVAARLNELLNSPVSITAIEECLRVEVFFGQGSDK